MSFTNVYQKFRAARKIAKRKNSRKHHEHHMLQALVYVKSQMDFMH